MARIACAKCLDRMMRRHVARLEMYLRRAAVIARDEAVEDFREEPPLLVAEPAHDAEVDGGEAAVRIDEQVARMHVGVKKAVAHGVAQERLDDGAAKLRQVVALGGERRAVRQRRAVDPFQRQHVLGGEIPVDLRHAKVRVVLGVFRHFRERRRLEPQVHLDRDRARQRIDDFDQPQPPRLGGIILRRARCEERTRRDRS